MLTREDKILIEKAKALVHATEVKGGTIKEVGCALRTEKGKIFEGVSISLACGIGFCAEHTAVATMITQTKETHIKTIVAVKKDTILPPCGRCRELLSQIDQRNVQTEIIINENKKLQLNELLPFAWEPE